MDPAAQRNVIRMNVIVGWAFGAFFGVLLALVQLLTGNRAGALLYFVLGLVMVALTYFLAYRLAHGSRIVYGDGTYTVYGLGPAKRFTVADIARVVTVNSMAIGMIGPTHHLFVTGPTKRLLFLVGQMWGMDQLGHIALDMAGRGVPLTPIHQPITPVQLRAHDSRLMPWWQAHRVAFALLVGLGAALFVVIAGVVILTIAVSRVG